MLMLDTFSHTLQHFVYYFDNKGKFVLREKKKISYSVTFVATTNVPIANVTV